jgi:hypothetical protein
MPVLSATSLANVVWVYDYDPGTGSIGNRSPSCRAIRGESSMGPASTRRAIFGMPLLGCMHRAGCPEWADRPHTRDASAKHYYVHLWRRRLQNPVRYYTTATIEPRRSDRLAGGLFAVRTAVEGLPENRFAIFAARQHTR